MEKKIETTPVIRELYYTLNNLEEVLVTVSKPNFFGKVNIEQTMLIITQIAKTKQQMWTEIAKIAPQIKDMTSYSMNVWYINIIENL